MKECKKKKIIILGVIFFVLVISKLILFSQKTSHIEKSYYQVIDNYNLRGYDLSELEDIRYNRHDEYVKKFELFNKNITENEDLVYLELGYNIIELIGYWDKLASLANGYGHKDLTNQQVVFNGEEILITPVNSIQIGDDTQSILNKDWFSEQHFMLKDDKIPLVLGHGFKEFYNIGEEIKFIFLREELTGYVVGFSEENEVLLLDEYTPQINLNSAIILPYINNIVDMSDEFSDYFIFSYVLNRNNGYLYIEDKSDFTKHKKLLEQLAEENNLDFQVLRGY